MDSSQLVKEEEMSATPEKVYRKAAKTLQAKPTFGREYVLAKADGTYSARNEYSAISRIAGFYPGSRIIPADEMPND